MAVKKKVVEIDTKEAQTSVKDLRQLLKGLKDTMLQTEKGTAEYNEALRQSADIMHTLKEQQEELNASAMDFGQIAGNCTKAVGGFVGGLLAAKAMMNLFGVENEDVIKSLQKMQSLMAITQALPAIDNGIKAFKRLSLVIKSATGAMTGFKSALVSTGLGALVIALGALVTHWDDVTAAMKRWGIIHQTTSEKLEEEKKKAEDLKDKLNAAKKAYEDWEKTSKVNNLGTEAKKKYDELSNTIEGANIKIKEFQTLMDGTNDKKKWEELRSQAQVWIDIRDKAQAAQRAILNSADATKTAEEAQKKQKEAAKNAAEELKKLTEAYKKLADEIALYGKSEKDKELAKLQKEEEEKVKLVEKAEKDTKVREERITAIHNYYAEERKKIEKKYADEQVKKEQELAFKELKLLEDNHKLQEAALKASLDNKEITLTQFNERKKELDEAYKQDYVSTLQTMLEDETLSVEKRLELYEKLNEFRNPKKEEKTKTKQKTEAELIADAINQSALALNDFSDNPAWGNILRNVATLAANWDKLNKDIKEGGTKAFTAYAQIAATALSAVAQMMNGLAAEQDTSNREGFESAKKFQIAGATMSMLAGITSAWASSMMLPFPANVIIGSILSAMMGTTGAFLIAKISQQQFDSKSSASATATPSTGAITSINAPVQYTQDVQGANIEGAIKDSRVYVVESDITNTQNRVKVTENEARF